MSANPARRELSLFLAGAFRAHLLAELRKAPDLLQAVTWEGLSFAAVTEAMLAELDAEFPEAEAAAPRINVYRRWWNGLGVAERYENSTFKSYNQTMFERIRDLRDGSDESRRRLSERMHGILRALRFHRREISYEVLYTGEGRFYELIRELIGDAGLGRPARRIWARQHEFVNRHTYRFFEEQLRTSLESSERLLHAMLPNAVAEEMREHGVVRPREWSLATILFTDIAGFTRLAETLAPDELLGELDRCFSHFDQLVRQHRLEKIKTIGDAYMCAGGILEAWPQHPLDIGLCALRIQEFMRKYRKSRARAGHPVWDLRVGIHVGPVIAGVIGTERFNFDVWGDTVNLASRMEDAGEPQRINVSEEFRRLTEEFFVYERRGRVTVKGKGELEMFFLKGLRPELTVRGRGKVPNARFRRAYAKYAAESVIKE